jgi:plasmid stabilization system protein ParE
MQVRWTANASVDLHRIARRIRQENPEAAREVVKTIYDSIMSLGILPRSCGPLKSHPRACVSAIPLHGTVPGHGPDR